MAESPENNHENIVDQAVQQFLDAQLQGQEPNIDEFVKSYPGLENQIRKKIGKIQRIDGLFSCLMQSDDSDFGETISEHDLVGQKLGDFEVLSLIGAGGMGAVFLARQISLDREVALKVISDVSGARKRTLERFKREAKVLAKISHPNIVSVYEVGEQGPYSYFAMEYIKGVPLDKILGNIRNANPDNKASDVMRKCLEAQASTYEHKQEKDDSANGAEIDTDYIVTTSRMIISMASALGYAHEKGVLHRDVKPSNILIGSDGTAKLVDFGLAKAETQQTVTMTGEFFGTPSYVSPEQIRKPETVDCRSDVYSLAAAYYECLTLHPPFEGDTVNETLTRVISREAVPPKKYCPRLSTDLNIVLLHALEKSPDDRYQSAADFAEDIRNVLDFKPIAAKRPSITRRAYKTLRRNPLKIAGIIALVLVSILAYLLISGSLQRRSERMAKSLFDIGYGKMGAENYTEAIQWFQKALNKNPHYADAYQSIGLCYQELSRHEESIEYYKKAIEVDPKKVLSHWGLGGRYATIGRNREAIEVYEAGLRIDPDNAEIHLAIAVCYEELGLSREAIKAYENAVEIDPNRASAWSGLAISYWSSGDYKKAVSALEKVITIEPENAEAYAVLGVYYHALGQNREAVLALQKATKLDPRDPLVHGKLGDCYKALGQKMGASVAYKNAGDSHYNQGEYNRALEAYSESVEISLNPNPSAYLGFGMSYARLGRYKDASNAYQQAVETAENQDQLFVAYMGLAESLDQLKSYDEAILAYQEAINIQPDEYILHDVLASIYKTQRRYRDAVEAYKKAINLEPDNANLYNDLGLSYNDLGRYEEAIQALKQGLTIDPNHAVVHSNLGLVYTNLGWLEEAIQACKISIGIDPKNATAYNNLGLAYNNLGRHNEAIKALKQSLTIDPNFAIAHSNLGLACNSFGRYEEAIQAYKEVLRMDPNNADAHCGLGYAYAGLKRYKESIESITDACKFTDYRVHIYIAYLALVYSESGDFDKAVEYQQKAIDLVADKEFTGIGITFDKTDGQVKVVNVIQDTPAHMSGLVVGDVIEAVNGQNIKDMSTENVANIIGGPIGTKVILTVKRLGKDTSEDITLSRDRIANPVITEYEKRLKAYKANKPWRE